MADTRRYESKFKAAGDLKSGVNRYNFNLMESSDTALLRFSTFNAFGVQNTVSGTTFNILARAPDFSPSFPSSSVAWDSSPWVDRKHTVSLYNNSGVLQSDYDTVKTGYTAKYIDANNWGAIFVAMYREIEVKNDSSKTLTFKFSEIADSLTWGIPGTSTQIQFSLNETTKTVGPGDTILLKGFEPIEIKFESKAIGGPVGSEHAYSVTDQYGSTRRMEKNSADYILKTEDGSIVDTPSSSGELDDDDGPIIIDDYIEEVWTEGDQLIHGDIGTGADELLHGTVGAGANLLLHEAVLTEEDTAPPGQPGSVAGYAMITISWSGAGYVDLDCCGYWGSKTAQKVGWSYSAGAVGDGTFNARWQGDDVGSGPEYIQLGVTSTTRATGVTSPYEYLVHLNFYGSGSGTSTANVEVTFGGVTLNKDIAPSTNRSKAATVSDPYVTITFKADGTPDSIA